MSEIHLVKAIDELYELFDSQIATHLCAICKQPSTLLCLSVRFNPATGARIMVADIVFLCDAHASDAEKAKQEGEEDHD